MIHDEIWERIKPLGKPKGAGLLCGSCIMQKLEKENKYDYWHLNKGLNHDR